MENKIKKYFTKEILIESNNAAIRENRNRQLNEKFLDGLSEDRVYYVIYNEYHKKDEIRVMILFDYKKMTTGFLDMSSYRYSILPTAIIHDGVVELEDPKITESKRPYPSGREWTEKANGPVPVRKQNKFRKLVLDAYGYQCAVCNIKGAALVRAAHIIPVIECDDDTINNGICLCHNHEIAFDRGILKIAPNGEITVKGNEDIGVKFDKIRFPKNKEDYPSYENLKKRFNKF